MNAALRIAVALVVAVIAHGCAHVPAQKVTQDRFDYAMALGDSWKRQTLANVVRLRYADAPVFLNVTSVINAYTNSGTLSANANYPENPDTKSIGASASGSWSNSPTVTYQPLTGEEFSKNLLRPVPPKAVLQLVQGGWPAELIFGTTVRSINGLHNQSGLATGDPRFFELVSLIGQIQRSDAVELRVRAEKDGEAVIMALTREENTAIREVSQAARTLLGLEPGLAEINVTYGSVPTNTREIAMMTRSMLEVMLELAAGIEVPPPHLKEQRVLPMRAGEERGGEFKSLVHIRSGAEAPKDAYAAIPYKGYWFWIDDRDLRSKRLFTFVMILFSLTESSPVQAAPLVTIPAGR
ncbi:MAG: hypothetical protein ACREVZ_00010 [Burkholderiales bacterium]